MILLAWQLRLQELGRIRALRRTRRVHVVVRSLLKFLPQFVENFASFVALQFALQFFQCHSNNVIVVCTGEARVGGHFKPKPVKKVQVLIA